ncbi:replication factor C subunit 1 [Anopheles ziemanni]|uniref:replication factor C subunit 1 n=1 Tax=Anopheles coustani TaxID=139045 RepID=UPI0026592F47|nr:replication factor C subunit 1 [Anopheles coustani]XP_058174366.1 replication factor C subunit 1 [Anopheles ziemanni]
MSMDIRSFFGRGGSAAKPSKAPEPAKTPNAKRKAVIISDDEEETERPIKRSDKEAPPSTTAAAKKRRVIDSDDEKTPVKKKPVEVRPKLEKLKPVNVTDVFSSAPVKRVELPKIPKKKTLEPVAIEQAEAEEEDVIPVTPQPEKKSQRKDRNGNDKTPEKPKTSPIEKKVVKRESSREDEPKKTYVIPEASDKPKTSPIEKKVVKRESSQEDEPKKKHVTPEKKRTIEPTATPKSESSKSKKNLNESVKDPNDSVLTDEERHERKRMSAILYQKFKNRQGPANPGSKEIPEGKPNCLVGLQFVITGVLESMERDECAQVIKDLGGKVVGAVSKKVTHMVIGDDAGPKKIAQAEDLGITTLTEDGLLNLIREKSGQKKTPEPKKVSSESESGIEKKRKESPREEKEVKKVKVEKPSNARSPSKPKGDAGKSEAASVKVKVEKSPTKQVKQPEKKPSPRKEPDVEIANVKREMTDYQKDIQSVDNMAWVDKYKPTSTKQIIGQLGASSNVQKLTTWLSTWYKNNDGTKKHAKPNPWAKNDSGAAFKAALLSGPPGVGKTTTATLVCRELGFDTVEFNASDTRSKRLLKEEVSELLNTKSLAGYFGGKSDKVSSKHVLLMDEVDGMAGNEDRGGMQELIALIKDSHIPVICMCNDRNHPKIRSLVNYCFDLRFNRPRVEQIKGAMMSVCFKEGLKLSPGVLEEIITGTGGDVRQTLNHLALYSAGKSMAASMSVDSAKKQADSSKKDIKIGPWDVIRKVFSAEDHKTMTLNDKADLFFHDYNIAPLFVQENYLKVQPKAPRTEWLDRIALTADSLSRGDMVDRRIRSNMAWTLLPVQAMYSSVMPGEFMEGHFTGQINFPGWLGKNSKSTKRKRLAQEIHDHTRVATSGSRLAIRLDYAPHLLRSIVQPLQRRGAEGVNDSLEVIKEYRLLREDIDSLVELSTWPKNKSPMDSVDGKVKAALTRAYNKVIAPYSYSAMATVKKKTHDAGQDEMDGLYMDGEQDAAPQQVESDEEEKEDKLDDNAFIKIKKKPAAGGSTKAGTSKASAPAKGKKK